MQKLPRLKKFNKVCVTWQDAQVSDGGFSIEEYLGLHKQCIRATLGFYIGTKFNCILICETDDRLANNWCEKTLEIERVNSIPIGMCIKIEVLN